MPGSKAEACPVCRVPARKLKPVTCYTSCETRAFGIPWKRTSLGSRQHRPKSASYLHHRGAFSFLRAATPHAGGSLRGCFLLQVQRPRESQNSQYWRSVGDPFAIAEDSNHGLFAIASPKEFLPFAF